MRTLTQDEVTRLLVDWGNGDKEALDKLVPIVYQELRRLARYYMRRERAGHTLETTALVNEAYMRLINYKRMQWQDRAHFFAIAAREIRRILVDHARGRNYQKRGGGARKVSLDEAAAVSEEKAADLIALDDALTGLKEIDEQKSRIVELRYFAGLSVEETAAVLRVSASTVEREWRSAKAWLYRAITGGGPK
jgi:RNA polymerase sigma-70 factor (ECF subfamily)